MFAVRCQHAAETDKLCSGLISAVWGKAPQSDGVCVRSSSASLCRSVWSLCWDLKPSGLTGSFAYLVLTTINIHDQRLSWDEYSFLLEAEAGVERLKFWSAELSHSFTLDQDVIAVGLLVFLVMHHMCADDYICLSHTVTIFAKVCLRDREADGNRNKLSSSWDRNI